MPQTQSQPQDLPILKPLPRRISPRLSTGSAAEPATPPGDSDASPIDDKSQPPSRSRSILNLTSSTLFGIYAGPSGEDISAVSTPGMMTPSVPGTPALGMDRWDRERWERAEREKLGVWAADIGRRGSGNELQRRMEKEQRERYAQGTASYGHRRRGAGASLSHILLRSAALFMLGFVYGDLVTRLHEDTSIVPFKIDNIDRHTWRYLLRWGGVGVVLGNLLPWIDRLWGSTASGEAASGGKDGADKEPVVDWSSVVRGAGAFIGMAFAIRHVPWESTLQASLTLALSNPALWYLVDRTITGFALSSIAGIGGAALLLSMNPEWMPSQPLAANATTTDNMAAGGSSQAGNLAGLVSYESLAVSTWVASVLFCGSVCFGNIGRLFRARS